MGRSPDPKFGSSFWLSEAAVQTDADGKFEIRGVPAGARFNFWKSGLDYLQSQPLDLDGAENTVTMLYGGAITGRALDHAGKPIRNFRVLVNAPRERGPADKIGGYFAGYSGIGIRFTSPDGRFAVTDIPAGNVCRITVMADGHGEAVEDRVTAVPVNHLKAVEPVVLRAGQPVSLRVRAVKVDGKPIAARA